MSPAPLGLRGIAPLLVRATGPSARLKPRPGCGRGGGIGAGLASAGSRSAIDRATGCGKDGAGRGGARGTRGTRGGVGSASSSTSSGSGSGGSGGIGSASRTDGCSRRCRERFGRHRQRGGHPRGGRLRRGGIGFLFRRGGGLRCARRLHHHLHQFGFAVIACHRRLGFGEFHHHKRHQVQQHRYQRRPAQHRQSPRSAQPVSRRSHPPSGRHGPGQLGAPPGSYTALCHRAQDAVSGRAWLDVRDPHKSVVIHAVIVTVLWHHRPVPNDRRFQSTRAASRASSRLRPSGVASSTAPSRTR